MRQFPSEFAELLSPRGRRILEGGDRQRCGVLGTADQRFLAVPGVIDSRHAARCLALLDSALGQVLSRMEDPIPPDSVTSMTENYSERLTKTVRVDTALLESRRARAYVAAREVGLVQMLRSESFREFASQLLGRPLRRGWGIQVLRYRPGDYAGPHNDHHPEEADARDGYLDVHLSFTSRAVAHQWLVYERAGHFSEVTSVATLGGLTAYRLPFWHYTTPLVARPGRQGAARRWVMLGTFLAAARG
jgi:hypothetical protein